MPSSWLPTIRLESADDSSLHAFTKGTKKHQTLNKELKISVLWTIGVFLVSEEFMKVQLTSWKSEENQQEGPFPFQLCLLQS